MNALLYQSWGWQSPLTIAQLVSGMKQRIGPLAWIRWPFGSNKAPLQGDIDEHGFALYWVTIFRQGFKPVLKGRFIPSEQGPTIKVIMTFDPVTWIFLAVWFGMLGCFGLLGVLYFILKDDGAFMRGIGVVALISAILVCLSYWSGAETAKNFLTDVLLEIHAAAALPGAAIPRFTTI